MQSFMKERGTSSLGILGRCFWLVLEFGSRARMSDRLMGAENEDRWDQ